MTRGGRMGGGKRKSKSQQSLKYWLRGERRRAAPRGAVTWSLQDSAMAINREFWRQMHTRNWQHLSVHRLGGLGRLKCDFLEMWLFGLLRSAPVLVRLRTSLFLLPAKGGSRTSGYLLQPDTQTHQHTTSTKLVPVWEVWLQTVPGLRGEHCNPTSINRS